MAADSSFDELMARLRCADQDAARDVFHRFADRLIGLAHRRLGRKVLPKVGAEDVVNSVFKSFFLRYAEGQFALGDWDNLWGLLVTITLRKCWRQAKRFHGPCHDVGREVGPPPEGDTADGGWESLSREPTPEEAAVLAEAVEQLLGGLAERERQVCELRLQGYTVPEIGERVGRTEFTVEGILKKIRGHLRRLRDDGAEVP
jgi:RNA polymerase sigma-70 factor (ECF subfamily)